MTIGQVAKDSGFAASAIRFYEQAGLLPKPARRAGRRRYDPSILERLAVVERAKACGFTLAETKQLFFGFREDAPPSLRWQTLAQRKLAELDELAIKIAATRKLLQRPCACDNLAQCGQQIRRKRPAGNSRPPTGDRVIATLRTHEQELKSCGIARLRLFGSVARGEAANDVDLVAEFDRVVSLLDLVALQNRISDLLGCPVDLAQERTLKPRVRANVDREARIAF